jgi:hypothetical protein
MQMLENFCIPWLSGKRCKIVLEELKKKFFNLDHQTWKFDEKLLYHQNLFVSYVAYDICKIKDYRFCWGIFFATPAETVVVMFFVLVSSKGPPHFMTWKYWGPFFRFGFLSHLKDYPILFTFYDRFMNLMLTRIKKEALARVSNMAYESVVWKRLAEYEKLSDAIQFIWWALNQYQAVLQTVLFHL